MSLAPSLIIIHNHRFPGNVAILDALYRDRFSSVFHLVPFHRGNEAHVIPVYEHSHQFQGYVAQGVRWFYREEAPRPHYLFIADDLLLNPVINEHNYRQHLGLREDGGFLPEFIPLHEREGHWRRLPEAVRYNTDPQGVQGGRELPTHEEAVELLARHGLKYAAIPRRWMMGPTPALRSARDLWPRLRWWKQCITAPREGQLPGYPLAGSYSDIFAVPGTSLSTFAHYCGAFAATRLFVELAIPTALAMSTPHISTERDTELKGRALWTPQDLALLEPYGEDLNALLNNFPKGLLYVHPVKLSRWKRL